MRNRLFCIGLVLTVVYFALVLGLFINEEYVKWGKPLQANEFGDFLAGLFGPVAIFWLVLGFVQQGQEVKQNSEALRLQVEELRNSVESQEKLVSVSSEQVALEKTKLELENSPRFVFNGGGGAIFGNQRREYKLYICNKGAEITDVTFDFEPIPSQGVHVQGDREMHVWSTDKSAQFSVLCDNVSKIRGKRFQIVCRYKDPLANNLSRIFEVSSRSDGQLTMQFLSS